MLPEGVEFEPDIEGLLKLLSSGMQAPDVLAHVLKLRVKEAASGN